MEQREIDNMLLSMIQKHFPSLPLSDEHTDWGKWLGFARAVYEAGRASPASAQKVSTRVAAIAKAEETEALTAAIDALEDIAGTSSSTRIRRVANEALKAIRARRKA